MVQGGDQSGTGKGGQSIWGKEYPDEIRQTLKFNSRGVVAMANAGPDTNKAQVYVLNTVSRCPGTMRADSLVLYYLCETT